jgi:MoaA/NifB/PqqE/SkfB family radical SAM enzyme
MKETFTSTGSKILRHLDRLKEFQETGIIRPISLQVAPTSRCNLNCVFCSNVNRDKHEDLHIDELLTFISKLPSLKTVEWTGGGDPTQYRFIKDAISYCHDKGLQQGFITNGIDLHKLGSYITLLTWIRVSLNSLDYVDSIDIPEFKGTLGFSYVMNQKTTPFTLAKVRNFVEKHKPKYVRIVPDCQTSAEDLTAKNDYLSGVVKEWGAPYFYQDKTFSRPARCWWGHFKPFLLHNGFVYPCSSVVLNDTAERSFHEKFQWMTMKEYVDHVNHKAAPYDCKDCTCCVFGGQNALIEAAIDPTMESFI